MSLLKRKREEASLSDSESGESSIDMNNKYIIQPDDKKFPNEILIKLVTDFKKEQCKLISTSDEYKQVKRKFDTPVIKFNYVQYNYKSPFTFVVVSNQYGICISNSEDFTEKSIMQHSNSLVAKHRVSLLMATAKYTWHKDSANLMTEIFESVVTDLRKLVTKSHHFVEHLSKHNIQIDNMKQIVEKLRSKFINGSVIKNGKITPTVFGTRLFTSQCPPVKILAPLLELKGNKTFESNWSKLAKPSYMHSLSVIKLSGFKITKSGISLDLNTECLLFQKIKEEVKSSSVFLRSSLIERKPEKEDSDDSCDSDTDMSKCPF